MSLTNQEMINDFKFVVTNLKNIDIGIINKYIGSITQRNELKTKQPSRMHIFLIHFIIALLSIGIVCFMASSDGTYDRLSFFSIVILSIIYVLPPIIILTLLKISMYIYTLIYSFFLGEAAIGTLFVILRWGMNSAKRDARLVLIIFAIVYIIYFAIAIYKVKSKRSEFKQVDSKIKKFSSTFEYKIAEILHKYGILEWYQSLDIMLTNFIVEIDKRYSYPSPTYSYKKPDTLKYINSGNIKSIIDSKESEVADYLRNTTDDTIYMPNNTHEKYLNAIKQIVKSLGDFPYGVSSVGELDKPDAEYNKNGSRVPLINLGAKFRNNSNALEKIASDYRAYKRAWQAFNNDYKITEIGESGERSILKELKFFSSDMIILQNIRLEVHDESVETDAILCSPYGIFAIETKNLGSLGSYNIVIDKDGRWRKVMKNGKWKVMGSVSKQNTRHLHGIETVINQELGGSPFIQAHSIIAFANDVVGIKNYSNNTIVRGSEIMSVVRSHERCLTQDQIKEIAEILKKHSLPPKKYPVTNWMKEIVCRNIRIRESYREMRESLKPLIDIRNMYLSPFSNQPIDSDVFDLSLEDDESEYETPEVPTNHNNNNTPPSSGGGSAFSSYNTSNSYQNSDDDEFDRAVGNCEMGNSYSYSWYDEDYNKPTWEK